ncbi:choice-of-anchor R domain-containing protein [Methylomonas sp. UP202]|uniref:choice-of-anchor R domain-containing protein n=1 Tax=Methylomonas sp. UP202 TaxID=3040943 RepID=UPI00247AB65E|nr:choice-of-anchor R domain-containing protein [Methylomonas sp. UP202]WGS86101.1 choice-of-anchor R domain-containing protein [Methylomonas sp. UP202]
MVGTNTTWVLPVAAAFWISGAAPVQASGFGDNLAADSGGTLTVSGSTWEAQSFSTDNQAYLLDSISLLISSLDEGTSVSLYSDAYSAPSQALATLTLSGAYTTNLAATGFLAGDFSLTANTTYWVVLSNVTGATDWSFQATDDGSANAWAEWDGSYWSSSTSYPFQMSVRVTPAAVPVPMSLPLMLTGLAGIVGFARGPRRGVIGA